MSAAVVTTITASGSSVDEALTALGRLPELIASIPDILREPSANPTQTLLLIAILVVCVLLILVTMVLVVLRAPAGSGGVRDAATGGRTGTRALTLPQRAGWHSPWFGRLFVASAVVVLGFALLVVTGVASSGRTTCLSCHGDSAHATVSTSASTENADPHGRIACVDCHESGGAFARATYNVFARFAHFGRAARGGEAAVSYGLPIASDRCRVCHRKELAGIVRDDARRLRMSHAEPLRARAECVDCHTLLRGRIARAGSGMETCARCHGAGSASGKCEVCHDGDPAIASRALDATGTLEPAILVPEPDCGSCHTSQKSCDGCHGIRLPHSRAFMQAEHARAGAIDIWFNGGRMCGKCHTSAKRPCTTCHEPFPAHAAGFARTHQSADAASGCNCHSWDVRAQGRTFCQLCHPGAD